jgi:energy-coupling factor transporter ATP-binding protein EcfA2
MAEEVENARKAQEQAKSVARKAEEVENARKAQEQAKSAARKAEEDTRMAKTKQEEAERAMNRAKKELSAADAARKEAERKLIEGIQPVVWPTTEEIRATKIRLQYRAGIFHFAIAGVSGSGKSSLINAFRGLRNSDHGAAPTGIVETTSAITRYPDSNRENPFVWYDVPGAGTLSIPDWEYFNAQGLFIFDCVIVLFDNRFTATDIAILRNCSRFNIPSYIVRSKSNQHILNEMDKLGYNSEDDEDNGRRARLFAKARDSYIAETRKSVKINLSNAKLPAQKVYMVSKDALLSVIKGKAPKNVIDEVDLLKDLLYEAASRRSVIVA